MKLASLVFALSTCAQPLPNTQPLTVEGDIASQMIDGLDRFLDKQVEKSIERRAAYWKDSAALERTIPESRRRLAQILGLRDPRASRVEMELVATTGQGAVVARSPAFEAKAVRWPAFADVHGEGLLLTPVGTPILGDVIAIPDAGQTPEQIAGLAEGLPTESQFARRLAENRCRVIIPTLLDRRIEARPAPGRTGGPQLTNREYVHRQAWELGRTVPGFEVAKIQAAIDWAKAEGPGPVGVFGRGEGGMLALYAAALDTRIDATAVSAYIGNHDRVWTEPIDRTIFGLTERFGNAELMLLARRQNDFPIIHPDAPPPFKSVGKGSAPGQIGAIKGTAEEALRAAALVGADPGAILRTPVQGSMTYAAFLKQLAGKDQPVYAPQADPQNLIESFDPAPRQSRQLHELERHCQDLIVSSQLTRDDFLKKADTTSPEKYEASLQPYREKLYNDLLGRFDEPLLPLNPRTRKIYDTEKYTGYEVVLDVFPDVFAYGVLLLPKDLKPDERRPVVVCQHGLEGRPKDTIEGNSHFYHDFAAQLANRGFITFAPQNPYIFGDRFRALSRKAAPIGKTLWSWIIPQHQQILAFLKSQPNVDPKRIAFYGLSYGGKTALRVPAVLTDYCLSICSGDFNEWVYKISTTRAPWGYVYTGEYEIYEFDLASTFNHAEMAALIAPRPFMVERGHFDGVSSDEWVAYEFAKVRRLYQGKLKLPADHCQIEFFDGPHEIHSQGTFDFLHKHLNWEKPR